MTALTAIVCEPVPAGSGRYALGRHRRHRFDRVELMLDTAKGSRTAWGAPNCTNRTGNYDREINSDRLPRSPCVRGSWSVGRAAGARDSSG